MWSNFQDVTTVFVYCILCSFYSIIFFLWTNHSFVFDSISFHIRTWSTFDCTNITDNTIFAFQICYFRKERQRNKISFQKGKKRNNQDGITLHSWNQTNVISKKNRISFFSFLLKHWYFGVVKEWHWFKSTSKKKILFIFITSVIFFF